MPPASSRRALLRAGAAAVGGIVGGCVAPGSSERSDLVTSETLDATPNVTGTYADRPSGPEPYPDRPDEPTEGTAVAFAEAFERARVVNSFHGPDVEEISAGGRAAHETAAHGGHYVVATGRGYANYADGLHADWGQVPALFFVSPSLVVRVADYEDRRVHCTDVYAAEDPDENYAPECEGDDAGYRVYNVHPDSHELSVTVQFRGPFGPENVLEREYLVGHERGVRQDGVTRRRGTYRLLASVADGRTATFEWDLTSPPDREDSPVTVLVTPAGGITVRRTTMRPR